MLKENLDFISGYGVDSKGICSLGGGSRSPLWSQIKADVCGMTVETMENPETTTLGAVMMAALAASIYSNAETICGNFIKKKEQYCPNPSNAGAYAEGYMRYRELYEKLIR